MSGSYLTVTYLAYLAIAVPITIWVGATLKRNGKVFLLDVFDGDEDLVSAVNSLLVVGFYLVNLGFVSIALKTTETVTNSQVMLETLSMKVGTVVLLLGVLHLCNLYVLNKLRRRAQLTQRHDARPPVAPDGVWATSNVLPA